MFGVNISALLDSLDTVAKETLEEPKESATRIRSKRKQAASQSQSQSSEKDLSVESSTRDIDEVIPLGLHRCQYMSLNDDVLLSFRTMKELKECKVFKKAYIPRRPILPPVFLWMRAALTLIGLRKAT
jgi:hypothetical protein